MTLLPIWTEQVKYLIGIFATLNPLGTIPIYLGLMADRRPDEMRRIGNSTPLFEVSRAFHS
jgi:multiple antibiotic resistance protein